jgi:hypothetical protein
MVCTILNISMDLFSYPSTDHISGLGAGGAWVQCKMRLEMMSK